MQESIPPVEDLTSRRATPRALVVDDELPHLEAMRALVERQRFETLTATNLHEARQALATQTFDVLLIDLRLPDGSALELLPVIEEEHPGMDVVLITGHASVDSAVKALRAGATDYLTKPIEVPRLEKILSHIRRAARLRGQVGALRAELRGLGRFGPIIGASAAMQRVYDAVQKVAPTDTTVLVVGETGTGKELVAAAVHELSARAGAPFVPLNCGAISPNLIESELFGHEKGSFTGATERHAGCFERAHGGTLFLDEVTEMPHELQVKLLRALECHEVQPIGGKPAPVDVRVVAATNRDPKRAVADGALREDLLYRLLVFPIHLPPLRAREDDLDLLADHFVAEHNRNHRTDKYLSRAARERLRHHTWPGNVRELRNVIERAWILSDGEIDPECLALASGVGPNGAEDLGIHVGMSAEEVERILTLATLDHYGERKKTAEVLGISLKTLYNRLKNYRH